MTKIPSSHTTWTALRASADAWPDKTALREVGRDLTYAQTAELVQRISGALNQLSAGLGTIVAVLLENHIDHALLWLSTGSIGSIEVPINPLLRGATLQELMLDSGAEILVVEACHLAEISDVLAELPNLKTVIVRGGVAGLSTSSLSTCRFIAWSDLLTARPLESIGHVTDADIFAIVYTSGTSGKPKGVRVTHAQTYLRVRPNSPGIPSYHDTTLLTLPMFHVAGLCRGVYSTLINGGTAFIVPRFSASRFWDQARESSATCVPLLGSTAAFLLAQPPSDRDRDHSVAWVTMSPPIAEVDLFRERFGVEIYTAYGMTESVALTSGRATGRGTGWMRPDFEMRVVDEFDYEVPQGTAGELLVRARQPWLTMDGYHNNAEATLGLYRNQWLHTGDLFEVLDDGELKFVGRRSDRIRRRGENISGALIEEAATEYLGARQSHAVGVPDDQKIEDEVLLCVVSPDGDVEPRGLWEFLCKRLPGFMVPRYIAVIETTPMTASQKIDRGALRRQKDKAWDANSSEGEV